MNVQRSVGICGALLVISLSACKKEPHADVNPQAASANVPSQTAVASTPIQALAVDTPDMEASNIASKHWNEFFNNCGGTWFTQIFYGPERGGIQGYQSMTEYRGLTWYTVGNTLSEADKLNGIQWNGVSEAHATAARTQLKDGGWGLWQDYTGVLIHRLVLIKKDGKWTSEEDGVGVGGPDLKPISCRDKLRLSNP